jgi:hypothetical protein
LGLKAIGVLNNLSEGKSFITVQDTYLPNEDRHRIYMLNYTVYASLYHKLKEEFTKLDILQSL